MRFVVHFLFLGVFFSPTIVRSENPEPAASVNDDVTSEVAGDPSGKKTFLIAWTFDDGPVAETDVLAAQLGINHVTRYVVKSNMNAQMGGWKENVKRYKAFEKNGGEIALHAQHPTVDHILWFPVKSGTPYKSYDSIEDALSDLKTFKKELEDAGLASRFTRLPSGLYTQLRDYANHLGLAKDADKVVRAIVKGQSYESLGLTGSEPQQKKWKAAFKKMTKDYKTFTSELSKMGVRLWGGSKDPNRIQFMSWEAESSGKLVLEDTVTAAVTFKKERLKKDPNYMTKYAAKFERIAKSMKAGDQRSLVIIAHDTNKVHTAAILEDKKTMESYAEKNGVKIEYLTMSQLFQRVTGTQP